MGGKVIVAASSKGGCGKTTTVIVLASQLATIGASKGLTIALVDADANQHAADWAKMEGCPDNIRLVPNVTEDNIYEAIEEASQNNDFVIVDVEGSANMAIAHAVSLADLVIVPCKAGPKDGKEAAKTVKMIKRQEKVSRREIPFSILFADVNSTIITRNLRNLIDQFTDAGIDIFACYLNTYEAYKSIQSFGGTISQLNPKEVSSISKADKNAKFFTSLVIKKIKGQPVDSEKPKEEEIAING